MRRGYNLSDTEVYEKDLYLIFYFNRIYGPVKWKVMKMVCYFVVKENNLN